MTPVPSLSDRLQALITTSQKWADFARKRGVRFSTAAKVEQGLQFAIGPERETTLGSHFPMSFAIPSCLRGVSHHQTIIEHLLHGYHEGRRLFPEMREGRVMLFIEGIPAIGENTGRFLLGFIKPKHEAWVKPLLATGQLRFYISQITGEQYRRQGRTVTLGVNILITDISLALGALSFSDSGKENLTALEMAA